MSTTAMWINPPTTSADLEERLRDSDPLRRPYPIHATHEGVSRYSLRPEKVRFLWRRRLAAWLMSRHWAGWRFKMRSFARKFSLTRTLCLATAAIVMCMGCGSTTLLSQLPPAEQTKYKGTEPGWHVLSPYFAVDIKSNGKATFYHLRDQGDAKARDAIGRQDMYWPTGELVINKRKFGPRESAYAVSQDGRSLLYFRDRGVLFDDPHREPGGPPRDFRAELHLYRHGLGDSLIVSDVDRWTEHAPADPPLSGEAVIYYLPDKHGHKSRLTRNLWDRGERVVRSIGESIPR
jgi:hypothetical protein